MKLVHCLHLFKINLGGSYMRNDKIKLEIQQLELSIKNLSVEEMEQLIKLQIACL